MAPDTTVPNPSQKSPSTLKALQARFRRAERHWYVLQEMHDMSKDIAGIDFSTEKPLSTKEAARMLGLSHRTLEDWRGTGRGPSFRKCGRAVRYLPSDIWAFLNANVFSNTGEAAFAT